jgi:hypothetical protein
MSPSVIKHVQSRFKKNGEQGAKTPMSYWITSPVANLGPMELILTFAWSPGLVCGTKTTKASILTGKMAFAHLNEFPGLLQ